MSHGTCACKVSRVRSERVVRFLKLVILFLTEWDSFDRVLEGLLVVACSLVVSLTVELEKVGRAFVDRSLHA